MVVGPPLCEYLGWRVMGNICYSTAHRKETGVWLLCRFLRLRLAPLSLLGARVTVLLIAFVVSVWETCGLIDVKGHQV